MSALGYLAVGYGIVWVLIAAYVWFIGHKQAALRRQIEAMQPHEAADDGGDRPSGERQAPPA